MKRNTAPIAHNLQPSLPQKIWKPRSKGSSPTPA
jgi:hypothetical protein